MPHSLDGERSVLGCVMMDNACFPDVVEILRESDFYVETNRIIFRAMCECSVDGQQIDDVTIADRLRATGSLEKAGGFALILELSKSLPTSAHVRAYAKIVRDHARVREVASGATSLAEQAFAGVSDVNAFVDRAQSLMLAVGHDTARTAMIPVRDLLKVAYERIQATGARGKTITGVPTGIHKLDEMTNGLQPQNLVVVAGHTSQGKTAFSIQLARHAAFRCAIPSAVFSLEMSNSELIDRSLCAEAEVDGHKIRTGQLNAEEWGKLARAAESMSRCPMFCDERGALTPMEIASTSRRLVRDHKIGLIVIDQLSHVDVPDVGRSDENIGAASGFFKALAKALNIPIVLASQLNEGNAERKNKRPAVRDIRGSKKVAHDADLIILLHRDDYYRESGEPDGLVDVMIGKQRNGPVGNIKCKWNSRFAKFQNLDEEEAPLLPLETPRKTKPQPTRGGFTRDIPDDDAPFSNGDGT